MVGDPGDNLAGLKGVGPKTATNVLKQIGHLKYLLEVLNLNHTSFQSYLPKPTNSLLEFIKNPKNDKLTKLIQDNFEQLEQTYNLATLQKVPGIEYQNTFVNFEQGEEICREYNFQSLIPKKTPLQDSLF
jgi:5'-3' exonuclease